MAILNPTHLNEIEFDTNDLDVFEIQDMKERVVAMRSRFFPRLELLKKESLDLAKQIYGIDPLIGMGSISSPNNRKDAAKNTGAETIHIGISGKRRDKNGLPLFIQNANGKPIYIHPAILSFDIDPEEGITVVFSPFSFSVEMNFVRKVCEEMKSNFDLLNTIFTDIGICYNLPNSDYSNDFHDLTNIKNFNLSNKRTVKNTPLFLEPYFFPANFNDELWILRVAFVGLYPLLDLFVSIADGRETQWEHSSLELSINTQAR